MATISANNRFTPGLVYNPLSYEELNALPQAMQTSEKETSQEIQNVGDLINTLQTPSSQINSMTEDYRSKLNDLTTTLAKKGYSEDVYNKFVGLKQDISKNIMPIKNYIQKSKEVNDMLQKASIDPSNVIMGDATLPEYSAFLKQGDSAFNNIQIGNTNSAYEQGQKDGVALRDGLLNGKEELTVEQIAGLPYDLMLKIKTGAATPKDVEDFFSTQKGQDYLNNQISALGYDKDTTGKLINSFHQGIVSTAYRSPEIRIIENKQKINEERIAEERKKEQEAAGAKSKAMFDVLGYTALDMSKYNDLPSVVKENSYVKDVLKEKYDDLVQKAKDSGSKAEDIPSFDVVISASIPDKTTIIPTGYLYGYLPVNNDINIPSSERNKNFYKFKKDLKEELNSFAVNGLRPTIQFNNIGAISDKALALDIKNAQEKIGEVVNTNITAFSATSSVGSQYLNMMLSNKENTAYPGLHFIPDKLLAGDVYKGVEIPFGVIGRFAYTKPGEGDVIIPTQVELNLGINNNEKTTSNEIINKLSTALDISGVNTEDGNKFNIFRSGLDKIDNVRTIKEQISTQKTSGGKDLTLEDLIRLNATKFETALGENLTTKQLYDISGVISNSLNLYMIKDSNDNVRWFDKTTKEEVNVNSKVIDLLIR